MRKSTFLAITISAGIALTIAAPSYAATASNSQNGTDSSNPNATDGPPASTSAMPATSMPMGSTPGAMQNGSGMGDGTMAPNGTMSTGAGTTKAPKQ